jgi:NADH:ubiquinone oxidoreductase subunit 3 (subunit A)
VTTQKKTVTDWSSVLVSLRWSQTCGSSNVGMEGFVFVMIGLVLGGVMLALLLLLRVRLKTELRSKRPLESRLSTTGESRTVFSMQFLTVLVLFLILDLEVVLIVSLVLSGSTGLVVSSLLVVFILVGL